MTKQKRIYSLMGKLGATRRQWARQAREDAQALIQVESNLFHLQTRMAALGELVESHKKQTWEMRDALQQMSNDKDRQKLEFENVLRQKQGEYNEALTQMDGKYRARFEQKYGLMLRRLDFAEAELVRITQHRRPWSGYWPDDVRPQ